MLRVVIDTSSLVSYVLTRGEIMTRVVKAWRTGEFILLSSPSTRAELESVLARPEIQRLSVEPLAAFSQGFQRFTQHVPGELVLSGVCRDAKDEKFLACAVEGKAHYLITSDLDLAILTRYEQVSILNPGQFLIALDLYSLSSEEMATRYQSSTLRSIHSSIPLEESTAHKLAEALER